MEAGSNISDKPQLESLLRRSDLWRGDSRRFVAQRVLATGYEALDRALLHKGWPLGALLEVCQPTLQGYGEWLLFGPALQATTTGYVVLLNPPALPFAQGLIQLGVDLNRLLVVQTHEKSRFIKSFLELARSPECKCLLSWQPRQNLTYTDIRKCLLSCTNNHSLNVLLRHSQARHQSSPASLRLELQLQPQALAVELFKQKGLLLKKTQQLLLPLPAHYRPQHQPSSSTTPVIPLFESL